MGRNLELAIGALNGTVGDYLARTGNGLATSMAFMHGGAPLALDPAALARAFPAPSARVVVLVHGLMNTEHVWGRPDEDDASATDYGSRLARDLGFTPLYVRYNSGLPIPDNGAALDALLTALVAAWPVPLTELLPLGYSMGGLVVRSACHAAATADRPWLTRVTRAVYVGTPHLGAPLERLGRVVSKVLHTVPDPTTRLIADIADLRSQGLQDLGDADLRHEDRARRRATVSLRDPRHPVPLLPGIRHYLAAGTLVSAPWAAALFGDTVVPAPSATAADSGIPASQVRLFPGTSHIALAQHPGVYDQLHAWLREAP